MSNESEKAIRELRDIAEATARDVSDLKMLMGGDWRDPAKVGMIHSHARLMKEMYDPKSGVLIRIGNLEITKREAMAYGAGAAFVVSILFAVIAYVVIPAKH